MTMNKKITVCICIGFTILFLLSVWELTNWETENSHNIMYNDFINAYNELHMRSCIDNDFSEHSGTYLNELSSKLAQRNIYAAAVILDSQGNIIEKTDVGNVYFSERTANVVHLKRLENCIRDAQNSINDENFPRGKESASISSSGPSGYTQGWTLSDNDGNIRYLFINAKFFELEIAIQKLISKYILTFITMGLSCFILCNVISKIVRKEIIDVSVSNE